jgi:hypothetical protein
VKRHALNKAVQAFELLGRQLLRFSIDRHALGDWEGGRAEARCGMLMRNACSTPRRSISV